MAEAGIDPNVNSYTVLIDACAKSGEVARAENWVTRMEDNGVQANVVSYSAVIDACAETGTWIELNANPWRFDMDWRLWQYAKEKGVKCVINTDSHRFEHQQYLRFGAQIARKGWLTKRDVINTLSLKRLRTALLWKRK